MEVTKEGDESTLYSSFWDVPVVTSVVDHRQRSRAMRNVELKGGAQRKALLGSRFTGCWNSQDLRNRCKSDGNSEYEFHVCCRFMFKEE